MAAAVMLDGAVGPALTVIADIWTQVTTAITTMGTVPLVATALALPLAGGIVSITKRLFRK